MKVLKTKFNSIESSQQNNYKKVLHIMLVFPIQKHNSNFSFYIKNKKMNGNIEVYKTQFKYKFLRKIIKKYFFKEKQRKKKVAITFYVDHAHIICF